jgi:hypothetical protein
MRTVRSNEAQRRERQICSLKNNGDKIAQYIFFLSTLDRGQEAQSTTIHRTARTEADLVRMLDGNQQLIKLKNYE